MFMDGMLYSTVAHNLAKGMGTFWHPVFSKIKHWNLPQTFHEQPPLGFYIQSLFYRIVGDSWIGDKVYILLTLIITTILISRFWQYIFSDNEQIKGLSWLPVLIWITIPVCFWSYRNDMCENTMGVFTLLAIWLLYKNMVREKPSWGVYLIAAGLIFTSSLIKGLPGLYPLAFPVLYYLVMKRHSLFHVVIATSVLLVTILIVYGSILLYPPAYDSLHIYFFDRLLVRVASDPTVGNHFNIIWSLTQELMIPIIISILAAIYYKVRSIVVEKRLMQLSLLFLLLGLSGTMPLMLTKVQKAFYCVAALPCFAMAAAFYLSPLINELVRYVYARAVVYKSLIYSGCLAIVAVFILSCSLYGQIYRDPEQLHDVHVIAHHIARGDEIAVSPWLDVQFSFECYLMRYDEISFGAAMNRTKWYFCEKNVTFTDTSFAKKDWGLIYTNVYERK
jgi:4-amino-4-deoxy-L-arabinose transferase-like glycosyltransferase